MDKDTIAERNRPNTRTNYVPGIKLNFRLLPILCVVIFILYLIDDYRGWSILLAVLGGLWGSCFLWVRSLQRGLRFQREMRFGWAQVGDRLEERFTLTNDSSLPALWVEVIDHTNMPDYRTDQVRSVSNSSFIRWLSRGSCKQRGLYTLGPSSIRTGDPFGIYTLTIHDPAQATLMVVPPVVPLPDIQVAPGGRAGEGSPRVNAPERTVSSASVREYFPGDSLRWVHWPTSARRGELYVRVFDGVPAGDWWIILDLDASVQYGEQHESTLEHGIVLTASLADLGMRSGHSVGLMAHGQDLVWLSPKMSDNHKWDILQALALIEPGKISLGELLENLRPTLSRNSSLIVITPSMNEEWVETLLTMRRQDVVPTVLLFDPETFNGEGNVGSMLATLGTFGIQHNVIPRELLNRQEARPGRKGHWEWRITPLGCAVPVHQPDDLTWRAL